MAKDEDSQRTTSQGIAMKNSVELLFLAVMAGLACSGCPADKKPTQAAAPAASPAPDRGLRGTQWSLEQLNGKPVIANSRATLDFPSNQNAAGNASCNRFTGPVDISGDSIRFGPLAATRMMCDPDSTRQENEYLAALAGVERYEIRNRLTLYLYLRNSDQPLKFHAVL